MYANSDHLNAIINDARIKGAKIEYWEYSENNKIVIKNSKESSSYYASVSAACDHLIHKYNLFKKYQDFYIYINSQQNKEKKYFSLKQPEFSIEKSNSERGGNILSETISNCVDDEILNLDIVNNEVTSKKYHNAIKELFIIIEIDLHGNIIYTNNLFQNILGYSRGEILGVPYLKLLYSSDKESINKEVENALSLSEQWHGVVKCKKKTGDFCFVETTIFPVLNTFGKIEKLIAFGNNITSHYLKQQINLNNTINKALEVKEKDVLELIPLPSIVVDIKANILHTNRQFNDLFLHAKLDSININECLISKPEIVLDDPMLNWKDPRYDIYTLDKKIVVINATEGEIKCQLNIKPFHKDFKYIVSLTKIPESLNEN